MAFKKNVGGQYITFALISAEDGELITGATVSGFALLGVTKSGLANSVIELADGLYYYSPEDTETDADSISFTFIAAGAVPVHVNLFPEAGVHVASIADAAITSSAFDYGAIQEDAIHNTAASKIGGRGAQLTWEELRADHVTPLTYGERVEASIGKGHLGEETVGAAQVLPDFWTAMKEKVAAAVVPTPGPDPLPPTNTNNPEVF